MFYLKEFRNFSDIVEIGDVKFMGKFITFSVQRNHAMYGFELPVPITSFNHICNIKGYNEFKRMNKYK